jgi:hypothetical protein
MATRRLTHDLTYSKGQGPVSEERLQTDAKAQGERFAEALGGADVLTIEHVGERSNGGYHTYRATYEVPLPESKEDE